MGIGLSVVTSNFTRYFGGSMDANTILITVLTCLVGVGVTILLAGIPWAYNIHGRLRSIEVELRHGNLLPRKLSRLGHKVSQQDTRLTVAEERIKNLEESVCDCEGK